jgi:beta-glucanase (GH16 family)
MTMTWTRRAPPGGSRAMGAVAVLSTLLAMACGPGEFEGGAPAEGDASQPSPTDAGGAADERSAMVAPSSPVDSRGESVDARVDRDGAPEDASRAMGLDAARPGWTLVFSDEFEGPSGTPVDTAKWTLVNKGDGFGNNELEFYTNRANNAALDGNGSLGIHAIREAYMGRNYTSARLESASKLERAYGRFEARIKLPAGQGIWPAFWALGADIGTVGWPACGEIDIMENIGREPSTIHGSLHGPGYSGGNPLSASYVLPSPGKLAEAFHVFAAEWEPDVVRFYVDDHLYETRTPADVPAGTRWVYDHPFFLILNVAVGGTWPGSPDSTTSFPQTMSVDYVRVYGR